MIDRHAVRHRDVEILGPHVVDELECRLFRNIQRAQSPSPVAEGDGPRSDAERWHQVVEEAVEMIGRELDDVVGRELLHEGPELPERSSNPLLGFIAGRPLVHQGRMGCADDSD